MPSLYTHTHAQTNTWRRQCWFCDITRRQMTFPRPFLCSRSHRTYSVTAHAVHTSECFCCLAEAYAYTTAATCRCATVYLTNNMTSAMNSSKYRITQFSCVAVVVAADDQHFFLGLTDNSTSILLAYLHHRNILTFLLERLFRLTRKTIHEFIHHHIW